jgi:hypothetical protein
MKKLPTIRISDTLGPQDDVCPILKKLLKMYFNEVENKIKMQYWFFFLPGLCKV